MRRPRDSKSDTCTEGPRVDTTSISRKVNESYSGRSVILPRASVVERRRDGMAEVSREHSSLGDRDEGSNMMREFRILNFDDEGDAE